MRDIGIPNGLAEVGYGDGRRRRPGRRLAPAAAAAGDRPAGRDRTTTWPASSAARWSTGDATWRRPGRGAAPARASPMSTTPTLARALYSSDASLYRVVPQVVVRPAARRRARSPCSTSRGAPGVPLTMRGAGTSIAGNAVGPGIVVDTSRHLNRVARVDPEARTAVVQPGVVHADAAAGRRPARAALRPGPVHAHPLHDRRDDRQQRLRLAGARLRPDRRQRRRAAGRVRRRLRGATGRASARPADGLDRLVDRHLAHLRTDVRPVRAARSAATRWSTCCRSTAAALDRFLVGSEGTLAWCSRRPSGWSPDEPRPAAGRARLPVDGRGRRRGAGAAAADRGRLIAVRGPRRPDRRPGARRGTRRARAARAAPGWLFVELAGDDAGEARVPPALVAAAGALGHRRGRPTRPRRPRCGGSARTAPGWPPAAWRRPAYSGWEDAAVPPERLGAYLRDFDALLARARADGRALRPLRRRLRARADRLRRSTDRRARRFRDVPRRRRAALRDARRLAVGGARRRAGPLRAAAADVRRRSRCGCSRAVKAIFDPDDLLNPGVLVDPAPLDADLRPAGRAPVRDRAPADPRRRLARRRGAPLHRRRQVRRADTDRAA